MLGVGWLLVYGLVGFRLLVAVGSAIVTVAPWVIRHSPPFVKSGCKVLTQLLEVILTATHEDHV